MAMKSLSEKLKSKVSRRMSEQEDFDLSVISSARRRKSLSNIVIKFPDADDPPSPNRFRSSSLSLNPADIRSRSRSASRRNTKELIRQETYQVIQKKLLQILEDVGLQLPIPLKTNVSGFGGSQSKVLNVYVANTHDCVYLSPASSTSFNYEDAENGGNDVPESAMPATNEETDQSSEASLDESLPTPDEAAATQEALQAKMRSFNSPNYLCTRIDTDLPIPHLFGIVVELKKEACVKNVNVNLSSVVKTLWSAAEGNFRHQYEEKFNIGSLEWNLSLSEADYFINTNNSNDTKTRDIEPEDLAKRTRKYYLNSLNRTRYSSESSASYGNDSGSENVASESLHPPKSPGSSEYHKAGIYVFLLPVLFPHHIPASVNSINGSLSHKLCIKILDVSEKASLKKTSTKSNYVLPMVRTPPSMANSVADKPIHVNRTWNDSLHYSITFPRKYVSLGSEHTINVQLVPLVKDVSIKRIKFNILERMTYVSRDLTREYDYDGPESTTQRKAKKCKERVVSLCELKTKSKSNNSGVEPFKEEVISCPNNNILYSCYEKLSTNSKHSAKSDVLVASPLDINIALPFLTSHSDKDLLTASIVDDKEHQNSQPSNHRKSSAMRETISRKESIASSENLTSPIIGSLETHISHVPGGLNYSDNVDEDILKISSSSLLSLGNPLANNSFVRGVTSTSRALSPDSNFRHIQISHRLQVCFRISKPDPKDNYKLHHYEVVVDTPVVLLSSKCNDDSIQLPKYDDLEDSSEHEAPPEFNSPPSVARPGINFRMPSYLQNGVSIRPLGEYNGEQLPSFEEATSGPSSPKMRSASVVSLDPTMPSDAPAYATTQSCEIDPVGQSTIDDRLVEETYSPEKRHDSMVKSSLQSSFAPVPTLSSNSLSSQPDNNTRLFGIEASETESGSDMGAFSSATNRSESSSRSLDDCPEELSRSPRQDSPEESPVPLDITGKLNLDKDGNETEGAESDISTDPELEGYEGKTFMRPKLSHNMTSISVEGIQGETQNIFGEDVSFDQKLLLLQNESLNEVGLLPSESKSEGAFAVGTSKHASVSMDTLNESSEPQSLYHAY